MATKKYQTLSEFLFSPFHSKSNVERDSSYSTKYTEYIRSSKIRLFSVCEVEDSYYYHIKVPSESQKDKEYEYDVIIRFFPEDSETSEQSHLRNYKIQFFSNSPSFMYKYAYVYKQKGYLIELLYDKLDADYVDTPPEKTNANQEISYDKSIYFACRFLSDTEFKLLDKNGSINRKKVTLNKFLSGISDFKSVRVDQALIAEERKLQRTIKSTKKEPKPKNTSTNKDKNRNSVTIIRKKTGKPKITGIKGNKKITGTKKK